MNIFLAYIARHKGLFAIDMVCAVVVAVIDLVFPYVSRQSMRQLLPEKLYTTFFVIMAILALSYILKGFLYYIITVIGHKMGVLTEADMRRDIFTHMQGLSCSFYDQNRTGVLMSRITSDLFEVTELSHHGPENVLICTLTILGALIMMFTMQWQLALVLAVVLPLTLWFTLSQRLRMKKANIEVKRKTAEITAAIESSISGVRTAKAFANEDMEVEKFDSANHVFKGAKVEYYKSMGLYMSGMEFTTGVLQVLVITVGGILIMREKMNYIDLVTFTL
ncbi:MAG: ABC transporter ATP-binding protein, partial [Oscillospiraceae bacterium]|nr:ABC transporter ATP-binding protein [Oscillospiraceae bacterium]